MTLTRQGDMDWATFIVRGPTYFLAWLLRKWADRLDGAQSFTIHGTMPRGCEPQDSRDALEFGAGAMARYLADVARERTHG